MNIYLDIIVLDMLDNEAEITLSMLDIDTARNWLQTETYLIGSKRYTKFGTNVQLEVMEIKLRIIDLLYEYEQVSDEDINNFH